MSRSVRRLLVALLVGAAAVAIPVLPVTAAHATAYRYWTYWHAAPGSSSWGFAGTGPTYRPSDGAVEGWRFAVSQGTSSAPTPRTDPAQAYGKACQGKAAAQGNKLVAVVLDYGNPADAPKGEHPPHGVVTACVEIRSNGTGLDVLAEANVSVRQKDGLVCGLNGYPKTECGKAVTSSPAPTAKPSPTKSSSPSPVASKSPSSTPQHSARSSTTPTGSATPTLTASASDVAAGHSTKPSRTPSTAATAVGASVGPSVAASASATASAAPADADAAPSLVVGDVGAASGGGSPWPLIVGGTVLALILGAAGLRSRWNR